MASETVQIPYRIYNPEPPAQLLDDLTPMGRTILACAYSRHHHGRVRQRWLAPLLRSAEPWIVPFVVQLYGGYVIDICADLEQYIQTLPEGSAKARSYATFARQNPSFLTLTEQRAVSYWACNYQR